MASCSSLVLVAVILLLSTNTRGVFSSYGEKEVLSLKKLQWSQRSSKTSFLSQKSRTENGATILEMRHRDCFSGIISDWNQRLQNWLQADRIRVKSIQAQIKILASGKTEAHSQTRIPIASGVNLHTLNYIVPVTVGGRNMTVIVDTGSDLTWVQCQPCKLCYNQPEPIFDPSLSSSYHSIPCKSSACQSLQFATGNSGLCGGDAGTCKYDVSYGDGSYTRGVLGSDRLILGTIPVENFVFGCGRNNRGLFGAASGLMGLGRSDLSLISQTSDVFGGVFSYCLPTTDVGSSGSLILGGDASVYKNSTPFSYTRMVPNPQLVTFYFLNLTGITVGGVATQAPSFGKAGILIDSGTVITRLPPSIYEAVKTEFLKQFSGYPTAPSFSILDTCFNLSSYDEVDVPTVKMQFEGDAELTVDVTGIVYIAKSDASQVCLALASLTFEDEIGIIGNYQQKNTRVIYDTKESKLGFAKESCSFY
ncbi:aspartyl protease family protein At5g10770 [Coffea eugenioides]|uniref:Aspartyl protease family protein At5g10770-like n=1 Tax=Coffea arabica TaxID=13443 RepID=A0A6P6XEP1_COFAR|nr:aspartyl protease family protein At5g10770-like [Coffea arabica]XP_027126278.1 aspartyl protease family protein At5g10770-like [Coffea arabica]XP_027167733.1 aspartyl protease family protein At5g10770 [Coffea eugenioides]